MRLVEQARHRAVENRITQKLQALIVFGTGTAVGQRRAAERGRHEHMAERTQNPIRQIIGLAQWNHRTFTVFSKCALSETFPK